MPQTSQNKILCTNCTAAAENFLKRLKTEKRIIDFYVEKYVCPLPFTTAKIHSGGDVYTCCKSFINDYKIGNIFENTLKEIWNGERVQKLRNRILSGDYSMCDTELCVKKPNTAFSSVKISSSPKYITLSYDEECNLKCIYCRDKKFCNSKEQINSYNQKIYSALEPILNELELISLSSAGEALYSKHSRALIKKISASNPGILWNIKTNGLLFTAENCKVLGIYGKINEVFFSLPAMDRNLYAQIMRGSDYDTVIDNINKAVYERNNNNMLKYIVLNAVTSSINYKELPKLAKFAEKNNIRLFVSALNLRDTEFFKDYSKLLIWNSDHPEFENFKQILKHPALNYDKITMSPIFKEIREME